MIIDVISDTVCPWCFIGKRRLERALAMAPDIQAEINWRPFQLNPDMPEEGMDRSAYLSLKFGGAARASQIYGAVKEAGATEDLDFNFDRIQRTPNTINSHRLIEFARAHDAQDAIVENMFRRYFFQGGNIGDNTILAEIAEESGLSASAVLDYLNSDADVEQVRNEDKRARRMGVSGVPCFVIDGRYAVSGAQEAEVLLQVFSVASEKQNQDAEAVS